MGAALLRDRFSGSAPSAVFAILVDFARLRLLEGRLGGGDLDLPRSMGLHSGVSAAFKPEMRLDGSLRQAS